MSQNSMILPLTGVVTGVSMFGYINNAFDTLLTLNSGASVPSPTKAYMLWADTGNMLLKQRNTDNDDWIILGTLDAANLGLLSLAGGNMTGALNEASDTIAAHATTCDIWSKPNNIILTGGAVTFTDLADAPQAGAVRWIKSNAAHVLTNNSNLIVQSGANVTLASGDWFRVEAITTDTFNILVFRADGTALVGSGSNSDEKAKVSANDLSAGYLNGKLVAGTGITLTENNNGSNETFTIAASGLADASVSQSKLKTTDGEVTGGANPGGLQTLPGGAYGFYPQVRSSIDSNSVNFEATILKNVLAESDTSITRVFLNAGDGTGNLFCKQRYIQSSPPFESYRKNDAVPLFVFVLLQKVSGKIVSTYVAPDPPWGNNGPTVINPLGLVQRIKKQKSGINIADLKTGKTKPKDFGDFLENFVEPTPEEIKAALAIPITQEDKNADMALIPHPFGSFDPSTQAVVVISPTDNKFAYGLSRLHEMGESVCEVLLGNYLTIDNTPMEGIVTPESVMAVNAKWK